MALQQQITSFVSTANVGKLSATQENDDSVFSDSTPAKPKSAKRPHTCLSSDGDHSLCIETELNEIINSMKNILKKEDVKLIVTETVTSLLTQMKKEMKKELKKEMMVEIQTNQEKVEQHFTSEVSRLSARIDSVEFDNENILEKNASLQKENRLLKEEIENTGRRATDAMQLSNWNEQYSRKKNVKIFYFPEKRGGGKLPQIVAAHRIPGKPGKPRPILVKFLRMESKIALLRNRKLINEKLEVRISDDVTRLNQGLLNRLYLHEDVTSAWYFNGHIYGTDNNGERHRFDIYDNIRQKLKS
ncbi:Hypothetical predicted protein [Mytilus galloprovincialis]|uniref:Uncharacterized protein n=1 Tax=Mytilus galloprovincialis TaxID=29158 RepID=A0A8B6CW96_MYTGA|nr:Hypothetical predicted protein [Mytilus galloprovincialis]